MYNNIYDDDGCMKKENGILQEINIDIKVDEKILIG